MWALKSDYEIVETLQDYTEVGRMRKSSDK